MCTTYLTMCEERAGKDVNVDRYSVDADIDIDASSCLRSASFYLLAQSIHPRYTYLVREALFLLSIDRLIHPSIYHLSHPQYNVLIPPTSLSCHKTSSQPQGSQLPSIREYRSRREDTMPTKKQTNNAMPLSIYACHVSHL